MKKITFIFIIYLLLPHSIILYSWTEISGKYNIVPNCIKVVNDTIYAGLNNGFMFAIDEGYSWKDIQTDLPYDFEFQGIEYFDNYFFAIDENYGIYISSNQGNNWNSINGNLPSNILRRLVVNQNTLWVTVENYGLFCSTNKGVSWKNASQNLDIYPNETINSLYSDGNNICFTQYDLGKIYYSSNNGTDWFKRNKGIEAEYMTGSYISDSIMLVLTKNSLYFSSNYGKSYKKIDEYSGTNGSGWYSYDIKLFNNVFYISAVAQWNGYKFLVKYNYVENIVNSNTSNWGIFFNIKQNIFCISYEDGIMKEVYDDIWTPSNNSPKGGIDKFCIRESKIYVSNYNYIYSTSDYGENWKLLFDLNVWRYMNNVDFNTYKYKSIANICMNNDYLFIAFSSGEVLRIEVKNLNYISFDNGLPKTSFNGLPKMTLSDIKMPFFSLNNFVYYISGGKYNSKEIYRSNIEINSWEIISEDQINSIYIDEEKIYYMNINGDLFYTNNFGNSWQKIFDNSTEGITNQWCFAIKDNAIYISTYNGIYYSYNNGVEWNSRYVKLDDMILNTLIEDINLINNNLLLVHLPGGNNFLPGVYQSSDINYNFNDVSGGLPTIWTGGYPYYYYNIRNTFYSNGIKAFITGTDDEGISFLYYTNIDGLITNIDNRLENMFYRNTPLNFFPNPIQRDNLLTIRNINPISKVKIIDILGNEKLEFKADYQYELKLKLTNLEPGLFFIILFDSGNNIITDKMIVE